MSLRSPLAGLGQGLHLGLLLRPRSRPLPPSGRLIVWGLGLHLLIELVFGWRAIEEPRAFFWAHLVAVVGSVGLLGLLSGLVARLLRRPGGWLPLTGYLLIALLPLRLALALWDTDTPEGVSGWLGWLLGAEALAAEQQHTALLLLLAWLFALALLWRLLRWLVPEPQPARHLLACALLAVGGLLPLQGALYTSFWYPDWEAQTADWEEAPPSFSFDPEALMYDQPRRLQAALETIPMGVAGTQELYAVAFGGDGAEEVFRNEVDFAARLFAERLGAGERVLALLNNPATVEQAPLATRTNLAVALKDIGRRMNLDEDVLLLFLTSHGSENWNLHVALEPLPLNPVSAEDLREMLDAAGIRWRILIVSACYSGGFIPALQDPQTLVITAARADRTSFGCGVDSDFTYFGRALLIDALADTLDWEAAFEQAKRRVAERETEEDLEASEPQIAMGAELKRHLRATTH
ncbi:C13 family peptidase [Aquimonas sp.]|jgi:hypothetical protein|uniref:C13 family peptidase n=1 Tax=Aquimonas sp. TaxID=1872588 RepID=UPI0037BFCC5A